MSGTVGLFVGIAVLAVGTYLMRLAGPLLQSRVRIPPVAQQVMDRAAIVLLVAVALTSALFAGEDFAGWARPAGVAAAVVAALCKAPLVAVIVIAMVVTAGLRFLGVA